MATAENLLALARAELGTVESPSNSNRVKYNTAYYGREVSGSSYAWCAVFLWWLFREAGASELYYGGGKTAYCPTLLSFHRGQWVTDYRPAYEEDTMTQEQFDQMMDDWLARRAQEPASDWAKPYIEEAIEAGAMAEVNGTIERPRDLVTREELAVVAAKLL